MTNRSTLRSRRALSTTNKNTKFIDKLPAEMLDHIVDYVDFETYFAFKLVCKRFWVASQKLTVPSMWIKFANDYCAIEGKRIARYPRKSYDQRCDTKFPGYGQMMARIEAELAGRIELDKLTCSDCGWTFREMRTHTICGVSSSSHQHATKRRGDTAERS